MVDHECHDDRSGARLIEDGEGKGGKDSPPKLGVILGWGGLAESGKGHETVEDVAKLVKKAGAPLRVALV